MMEIQEIQEYLPHRYPFLLIDRVVSLEVDKSIEALKNVSINEPFFNGHFPKLPIMPGVLIVEAMAQASGILGFKTVNKKPEDGTIYMFVGADNLRFKRPVIPGDQLSLRSEILSKKRHIWKFKVSAHVGDEFVSSATMICAERNY